MSGLIGFLSGAPQQASTFGNYYQNAANEIANQYGSPAAQMFGKEQQAALRPLFQNQQDQLTAQLAAQGIAPSGAGRAAFGNLAADQASTLAGAVAPLYAQGEQQYGNIIGQMPGAQVSGYQDAISSFYQALQMAGQAAAGIPPTGGGGGMTQAAQGIGGWESSGDPGSLFAPGQPGYMTQAPPSTSGMAGVGGDSASGYYQPSQPLTDSGF